MLIPSFILVIVAFAIGALSSAKEKLFLGLVFIGLPAFGFCSQFIPGFKLPFHAPNGTGNWDRVKDLFLQIPEEYRLGFVLIFPAFILGRILTVAIVSARKEKHLTPEQIKKNKHKVLKSFSM